ncbi:MAG: hypothetical protein ACRDGM_15535 [bacterium]
MWNGNAIAVGVFSLTAIIVLLGGCDNGPTPRREAAHDAWRLQPPGARYRIDPERNRIWFLAREGVFVYDVSRPERMAVSLPGWINVDAPYSCLPDLALGPRGEAIVTSNVVPTLWRIDPDTLATSVHPLLLDADTEKDVGFSALAYSARHEAFIAASYAHGSLWKIDALLKRAEKIPLSAPIPGACGITVRSRSSQQALGQLGDLCVRTQDGGWAVIFGPGWRSAYVSAAPCRDRPGPLDAALLKGE